MDTIFAFARRSASRFVSLGAQLTASSMSNALAGNRVAIHLFNADPFPRLSVHVGTRSIFLLE